jgi:hypothetical protein
MRNLSNLFFLASKPATQTTLSSSSRVSESVQIKNNLPFRRTTGAKSKRCCRDGARVEIFEGPPRKRANIDDEEEEYEEDASNKEATWQANGSPPPPDTSMLTRIAELANLRSSDNLKHIQNLLAVIQKKTSATLNPTSANDLTLKNLIRKCQTNDEDGQYLSFISMIDNIRLAFHLALYVLGCSTIVSLFTQVRHSVSNVRQLLLVLLGSWIKTWDYPRGQFLVC